VAGRRAFRAVASHEHFIDLCNLDRQPTPAQADPTGQDYCFEKPVKVTLAASKGSKGEGGVVDVWKRGCFSGEYKRKDKYKTEEVRSIWLTSSASSPTGSSSATRRSGGPFPDGGSALSPRTSGAGGQGCHEPTNQRVAELKVPG
jgi:hypothetical protein